MNEKMVRGSDDSQLGRETDADNVYEDEDEDSDVTMPHQMHLPQYGYHIFMSWSFKTPAPLQTKLSRIIDPKEN